MGETNSDIRGEDRQSYFLVTERPTVHPGYCLICGSVERPVVQLAPEVDYADLGYGALLLCVTCILQAASKFQKPAGPVACEHAEELERWKQALLDDVRSYITEYAVDNLAVPIWRGRDSVPEQAESENISGTEQAESEPSGPDQQAERDNRSERSDRVPGNSNDGSSDKFGGLFSGL